MGEGGTRESAKDARTESPMDARVESATEALSTLVRKGLCPVTKIRHQNEELESHSLYYEQHGNGPEKVLFIMGYGSNS